MIWIIIGVVIVVAIVLKSKSDRAKHDEWLRQEKERLEQVYRERKKDGEPKVTEALPSGAEAVEERLVGADGKEYPDPRIFASTIVLANFSTNDHDLEDLRKKYEYSPVFCMLASEHYIRRYMKDLKERPLLDVDQNRGIACIYELAENYAYSAPAEDDLVQADHYMIRRLEDRKRAMEGNGYYKNAYGFPANYRKAAEYYDLADAVYKTGRIGQIDMKHAVLLAKCWLQSAHIHSATAKGVQGNIEKAGRLYSQAFQMAMRQSDEDMAVEVIHAITGGYPRHPETYTRKAYNMLADWACRTDFGLAMYAEYIWYIDDLDRNRLAESPESAVALYRELAESNHYAAYMLGRAMLYGYGTEKDEAGGRRLLEAAAEDGCVSALYLLKGLSCGNPEEEKKWNTALYGTIAVIASKCESVRASLKQSGMSVTEKAEADFKRKMAAMREQEQRAARVQTEEWEPADSGSAEHSRREEAFAEEKPGFAFPQYLYDDAENPWELMNSGGDNATYYCQKTGGQITVYASDFASGAPSGFHRR